MSTPALPLLLVKTGDPTPDVASYAGDYGAIFSRHVSGLAPVDARTETLPDPKSIRGAIVTGSACSVLDREPWADALADWLKKAAEAGKPILGVCYGHQMLAHAFGGEVSKNPRGYELGTVEIKLTPAGERDPLFSGLTPLEFSALHRDVVSRLPENATLLATNDRGIQAFAIGDRVRAVQFHPEFDARAMMIYSHVREPILRADAEARGLDFGRELERIRSTIRDSPSGPQLLRRFVDRFFDENHESTKNI